MPNPVFLTPWSTSSLQYETLGMGPGPGTELRFSVMHKAYEAMLNSFTELSVNGAFKIYQFQSPQAARLTA